MEIFWFAGISWSPDVELMTVKCWPFCLPRELWQSIITAVQILPSPDVKQAMRELQHCPQITDAFHIFARSFNKAYVCLLSTCNSVLCVQTEGLININNEYTAAPLPHTGSSNHLTLLMNTVYTPRVRKEPPVVVDVVVWAQEAVPMLWAAWSAHHGAFSDNIWGLCGHRGIYWGCDVRLSNQDCLAVNVLYYNRTEFDSVLLAVSDHTNQSRWVWGCFWQPWKLAIWSFVHWCLFFS